VVLFTNSPGLLEARALVGLAGLAGWAGWLLGWLGWLGGWVGWLGWMGWLAGWLAGVAGGLVIIIKSFSANQPANQPIVPASKLAALSASTNGGKTFNGRRVMASHEEACKRP